MTMPPVTSAQIAELLDQIRRLAENPTTAPAIPADALVHKTDLLARKADLLGRLATQHTH